MKRVFYVIDLPDPELQKAFDSIRLVCDPSQKNRAHITVRGPYKQRYRVSAADARVRGALVEIDGPDAFFEEGQNTVFLQCKSDALSDVWRKPDFDFAPHLTLYDGQSREFAVRLLSLVREFKPRVTFKAQSLSTLVSRSGQQGLGPAIHLSDADLETAFGEPIKVSEIGTLDDESRLNLVRKALTRLRGQESQAHLARTHRTA